MRFVCLTRKVNLPHATYLGACDELPSCFFLFSVFFRYRRCLWPRNRPGGSVEGRPLFTLPDCNEQPFDTRVFICRAGTFFDERLNDMPIPVSGISPHQSEVLIYPKKLGSSPSHWLRGSICLCFREQVIIFGDQLAGHFVSYRLKASKLLPLLDKK